MNQTPAFIDNTDIIRDEQSRLRKISEVLHEMTHIQEQIEEQEEKLQQLEKAYRKYTEEVIPDMFDEYGISSFTLQNGKKVSVTEGVTARISKKTELEAHNWLELHGFGDIIKDEYIIRFGKGEHDKGDKFVEVLESAGVDTWSRRGSVHSATLKALVREQVANKNPDFVNQDSTEPLEAEKLFGIYRFRKTTVK